MTKSSIWQKIAPFFIGALVIFTLVFSFGNSEECALFDNEQTTELNTGWTLHSPDGTESQPISLPTRIKAKAGEPVLISYILPEDTPSPIVLCFRSSQQQVRVLSNGSPRYSFGHDASLFPFGKSPGSVWNLVRLPEDSGGAEITIELISPYSSYAGRIGTVYQGSKASLLFMLLREHILSLFLTILIFFCGIALLMFHFIFLRKNSTPHSVLHLGKFALLLSGWMLGESKMVQFFVGKPLFALTVTFICMLLFPISLLRYIRCMETFRFKPVCSRMIALLYLQLVVVFSLQIFNVFDLIEMLPAIHIVFFVISIIILSLLLLEHLGNRQQRIKRSLSSLFVLLLAAALEAVFYYIPSPAFKTGVLLQMGMLIFIIIQAKTARNHALYILRLSREATTDGLTGCQNRLAYSKRLQQLSLYSGLAAVVTDMNGLKQINDTMGHAIGDEAILLFARCFKHIFGNFGDCYRIGGDEFVFISRTISDARVRDLVFKFEALCAKQNEQLSYRLEAAIGYAVYDSSMDRRVSDLIRRADQAMYIRKKQMKQNW